MRKCFQLILSSENSLCSRISYIFLLLSNTNFKFWLFESRSRLNVMRAENRIFRTDVIWRCCFIVLEEKKRAKYRLLYNSSSASVVAFDVDISSAISCNRFETWIALEIIILTKLLSCWKIRRARWVNTCSEYLFIRAEKFLLSIFCKFLSCYSIIIIKIRSPASLSCFYFEHSISDLDIVSQRFIVFNNNRISKSFVDQIRLLIELFKILLYSNFLDFFEYWQVWLQIKTQQFYLLNRCSNYRSLIADFEYWKTETKFLIFRFATLTIEESSYCIDSILE